MKIENASTHFKPFVSPSLRAVARLALRVLLWGAFLVAVVLAGFILFPGLLAIFTLGSPPIVEGLVILTILTVLSVGLSWLLARFFASARSVALFGAFALGLVLIVWTAWALKNPVPTLHVARGTAWGDSDVWDYQKFPERVMENAGPAFYFDQNTSPELFQTIKYRSNGEWVQADFEEFLESTNTTSLIIIQNDAILYENYFNGYSRDSIVTSFSMAKSFTSALIGIAIGEGLISSVNDPVIEYIPELRGRGLDEVTIRHLLLMASGIQYLTDDEAPVFNLWFTDDAMTYYYPDLRLLALSVKPSGDPPGTVFKYNNYNPLLLGMILERATGMPVAEYLQEKLWKPLGMEYPGSWSIDSEQSGFEKMESGINGRAIDFAKFGRLFLNGGNWSGKQIIPASWVRESTASDPNYQRTLADQGWENGDYYGYMWWGAQHPDGSYDYAAMGNYGQYIMISPDEKILMVRHGIDSGGDSSWEVDDWGDVLQSLVAEMK